MKNYKAEMKLMKLIAESGNEEMQTLFLEMQTENNRHIAVLADMIGLLAYGSVHMIGVESAKNILDTCEKLKSVLKPDTSINDNLEINEKD